MGHEFGRVLRGTVELGVQAVPGNTSTVLQKSAERPGINM